MTFDEQLQRALDSFAGRLREEVTREVRVVGDELAAAVRAEHVPADVGSATGRLAEGIRAIGGAQSLTDVLDTLVDRAGQEAARLGVLLVRGDRFHGWRFVGFDRIDDPDTVDIAGADAGVIEQAAQTADVASPGSNGRDGAPAFADLPPALGCVAIPIAITGHVVAVLYADAGATNPEPGTLNPEPGTLNPEPGTLNLEPLEILTRFASQRLEALTAIKAARSLVAL